MNIQNSILLPKQTDTYILTSNSITMEKNGIYEITFCGALEGAGIDSNINIILVDSKNGSSTTLSDMAATLSSNETTGHFSKSILLFTVASTKKLLCTTCIFWKWKYNSFIS